MDKSTPAQAATRLLLQQRLHSLRFDITKLSFDKPIVFDTIQRFCATTPARLHELTRNSDTRDGLTLRRRRGSRIYYVVLYNESQQNPWRRRFTLAHELGHIYLGHLADGNLEEREANAFASQLLLPRVLVEQLQRTWPTALPAEEVSHVFGVSRQAAESCLRALDIPVPCTDEDFSLLERFSPLLPHPREPVVTV